MNTFTLSEALSISIFEMPALQQGRINLSRRDAILALEAKRAAQEQQ